MLTPATGDPSESLQARDARFAVAMRAIINDPSLLAGQDPDMIDALVAFCMRRLLRVRMGGRSVPLVGLSVLLWNAKDPIELPLDLEQVFDQNQLFIEVLLTVAFSVAMDPSYIWPEWGIVLAGVLICCQIPRLPEDSEQLRGGKRELANQCRLRLRHLVEGNLPRPSEVVRNASRVLDEEWRLNFPNGLQPVVDTCLNGWPSTSGLADVSSDVLQERIDSLDKIQPAWYSDEDRRLYRLSMERSGAWIISSVVLRGS